VKLKVGRRVTKGGNDTQTDFKAKKIIIKEAKSLAKDPLGMLVNCTTGNTQ